MLPLRTDSPLRNTPYMNWAIMLANVVMFVLQGAVPAKGGVPWWDGLALNTLDAGVWQYVTYAFLHDGPLHIFSNMLFLYIFGNNVNDKMGNVGYLAFYLAGGVFAGIAFALVSADEVAVVVGASGAVAAVTGAYLILFPRSNVTILNLFLVIGLIEIPCMWFVLIFFVKDLVGLGGQSDVAHSAHIGGTLFGAAVSTALLAAHLLPRDQFDVVALMKQWNRRRQYRDAVSAGWNPYGHANAGQGRPGFNGADPPPDAQTARVLSVRAAIGEAIAAHDVPRAAELYTELKAVDAGQVLGRQAQLDVANQLAGQQKYRQAAEAYELFLLHYPKFEQIEQVELMLGIIYARYLEGYERARAVLLKATARLHTERELEMARAELARIEPLIPERAAQG